VDHRGKHFTFVEAGMNPVPIQHPRVPIWVGGYWPKRGPLRRALRWDGYLPACDTALPENGYLTPEQMGEVLALARTERPPGAPFDLVLGGCRRVNDLDREIDMRRRRAEAGATWWLEYLKSDAA